MFLSLCLFGRVRYENCYITRSFIGPLPPDMQTHKQSPYDAKVAKYLAWHFRCRNNKWSARSNVKKEGAKKKKKQWKWRDEQFRVLATHIYYYLLTTWGWVGVDEWGKQQKLLPWQQPQEAKGKTMRHLTFVSNVCLTMNNQFWFHMTCDFIRLGPMKQHARTTKNSATQA